MKRMKYFVSGATTRSTWLINSSAYCSEVCLRNIPLNSESDKE